MSVLPHDLWSLTFGRSQIDPDLLAAALEREASEGDLDYRTRLLIRDSMDGLARHWAPERFEAWLAASASRSVLEEIRHFPFAECGFPSLPDRIMESVRPQIVHQYFRDLGQRLQHPARIQVGGSIALILGGNVSRSTEDIDVVNEIPAEVRQRHDLVDQLQKEYGLRLTQFQSHYLPAGSAERVRSLGRYGRLDVFLVDPLDVFVGKLFARAKDAGDLRVMAEQLDKSRIEEHVRRNAGPLTSQPQLADHAKRNWYVLFGEDLPA